ncbi:MAG: hypothetical protein ACO3MG_03430 [Saprospiraceae bacterium]
MPGDFEADKKPEDFIYLAMKHFDLVILLFSVIKQNAWIIPWLA